jgi:hypothetical protein
MIEGDNYINAVKTFFSFLETEFEMNIIIEKQRGNIFYDIQYGDQTKIISISYENITDYMQIIVFLLDKGKMPNYDDKTRTLHLNVLNKSVVSKVDKMQITANIQYFAKYNATNKLERDLLKKAKELRLCISNFDFTNGTNL